MKTKSLNKELAEIISKLAGKWHSEERNDSIDFSHTDRILSVSPVKIMSIGHRPHKTNYIIGIQEDTNLSNHSKFYFEIGKDSNKKRYLIKVITKSKMVVNQIKGFAKSSKDIIYTRQVA